jgi:hypothetical protein
MFRSPGRCNKNEVHLDPQTVVLMIVTTGAGWLMIESGVLKNLLERRRGRRVCPSCGRSADNCACTSPDRDGGLG